MKEIKAFIHRNRAADVVHALHEAGFFGAGYNLSLLDVAGNLKSADSKERRFSVEFGDRLVDEVKLELVCDDTRVEEAVEFIREHARTNQAISGWIYVTDIYRTFPIEA